MKKYALIVLLLAGIAGVLLAQETYTVPVPAAGVTRLDRERARSNARTCTRFIALPPTCTQAQVCVAAGAAGGAACTAVQARAADVELFAATQAGRELFLVQKVVRDAINHWISSDVSEDRAAFCTIYNASPAATCTLVGLPSTCVLCQ